MSRCVRSEHNEASSVTILMIGPRCPKMCVSAKTSARQLGGSATGVKKAEQEPHLPKTPEWASKAVDLAQG
jgi:hypothetical protein